MKKIFILSSGLLLAFGISLSVQAASPMDDLQAAFSALEDDFTQVSEWINKQQSKSVAFGAAGSLGRPANVKSFPGIEIGVSGGLAVAVDPTPIVDLSTYAISSDFLNLPPFFFTPTGIIRGKIGLFKLPGLGNIDLGMGFSDYNISLTDEFDGTFSQWQLEGRLQLLPDNMVMPIAMSVTIGVGNAKGNFIVQHKHTETINSITYNNNTYDQTLDTVTYMSSDWNVTTYYAKLMVSKNLIFITPYAGVGLQAAGGDVNTVIGAAGTINLDPALPGPDTLGTVAIKGPASTTPSGFDYRLLAGAQLNILPMIGLNLTGEYGQDVYAFSAGLIISFL